MIEVVVDESGTGQRLLRPLLALPLFLSSETNAMTRTQAACAALTMLFPALASGGSAYAQAAPDNAVGSINLGARGGIALGAPVRTLPAQDSPDSPVEFNFRTGLATDYIYRGTTLSAHQPAGGAALEATLGMFYAG